MSRYTQLMEERQIQKYSLIHSMIHAYYIQNQRSKPRTQVCNYFLPFGSNTKGRGNKHASVNKILLGIFSSLTLSYKDLSITCKTELHKRLLQSCLRFVVYSLVRDSHQFYLVGLVLKTSEPFLKSSWTSFEIQLDQF